MGTLRKASRASAANMNSVLPVEGGSTLTSNVKKAVQRMTILGRAGSSKVLGIGGSGNSNHNNDHGVKIANKTELMKNIRVGRNMYLTKKKSEDGGEKRRSCRAGAKRQQHNTTSGTITQLTTFLLVASLLATSLLPLQPVPSNPSCTIQRRLRTTKPQDPT